MHGAAWLCGQQIYNNLKVTPELPFTIHYMSGVLKYERAFVANPNQKVRK